MTSIGLILENYNVVKEGGKTHRRHFTSQKSTCRYWWTRKHYAPN